VERINDINRDRVLWCCRDFGITVEQLAIEAGIAPATITRFVQGEVGLTFNQLKAIAEHFGRGILFFMEQGAVESDVVHTPQFRTLANQRPDLSSKLRAFIERVERQRDTYLALQEDVDPEDRISFQPPHLPDRAATADAAERVRLWLGLGPQNNFDSYRRAIEAKGILVFRTNGYAGQWQIARDAPVLGFSLVHQLCPVIVVKKQDFEPRQSFTLIHELAHLLLHQRSWIDNDEALESHGAGEREANEFAGLVLVPRQVLNLIVDGARPADFAAFDAWLERARRASGASTEVLLRRLVDEGRLNRDVYGAYRNWRRPPPALDEGGNRAFRYREPRHIFGDRYVRTVLGSLEAGRITLSKASDYLDSLKVKDIRQLEQFYASL
jgi:Zn-dependent peptidase ImmA (M78 family)